MLNVVLHSVLLSIDRISLQAFFLLGLTFVVFWLLMLFGRVIKKYRGIAATFVMFVNTVVAFWMFLEVSKEDVLQHCFRWIDVGNFQLGFGVRIDSLSALFALIVCFISFLVHLFSIEYLRGDRNFEKYFGFLSLFTCAMLGIIFSQNLLQLFAFWELVGFSSYLLIGFWYQNDAAVQANKKAFLVNRIGDVGFLLGILLIFAICHTLKISDIQTFISNVQISKEFDFSYLVKENVLSKAWLIVAALGIVSGALAKSAQLPFSVWLPNAMEGPTPVSALIHAATMVAAGIYLLARFTFLMPIVVLDILACIGAITAFMAAITAISQTDIKRVLAYSTISQLGYMVMAIGVEAYDAALFHLLTHAFFKAGLFLCAGAIIHSLHKMDIGYGIKKLYPDFDEQNMRQMGGLRQKMPFVFWVYTIALCGIIGVPFFSGFLSKDAILYHSLNWAATRDGWTFVVPALALITVALTAFYMLRQYFMVFFGENRLSEEIANAPKGMKMFVTKEKLEAPLLMKISPFLLAILTLAPVFSLNPFDSKHSWVFDKFPSMTFLETNQVSIYYSHAFVSIFALALTVLGVLIAYFMFKKGKLVQLKAAFKSQKILYGLSKEFWHLDALGQFFLVNPQVWFSRKATRFDQNVLDKIPEILVFANLNLAKVSTAIDTKIIDRFVQFLGLINVIFAQITAWIDTNIVDGIVNLLAEIGSFIGSLAKITHNGKLQNTLIWSFVCVFIFILTLLIVK